MKKTLERYAGIIGLALLLLVVAVSMARAQQGKLGSETTHERTFSDADGSYVIRYHVRNDALISAPVTYPAGQFHYSARIEVLKVVDKKRILLDAIDGFWTKRGCFEDDPRNLVLRAKEKKK